jgi:hypothetical protein
MSMPMDALCSGLLRCHDKIYLVKWSRCHAKKYTWSYTIKITNAWMQDCDCSCIFDKKLGFAQSVNGMRENDRSWKVESPYCDIDVFMHSLCTTHAVIVRTLYLWDYEWMNSSYPSPHGLQWNLSLHGLKEWMVMSLHGCIKSMWPRWQQTDNQFEFSGTCLCPKGLNAHMTWVPVSALLWGHSAWINTECGPKQAHGDDSHGRENSNPSCMPTHPDKERASFELSWACKEQAKDAYSVLLQHLVMLPLLLNFFVAAAVIIRSHGCVL